MISRSKKEKEEIGRKASIEGFANELIACGILMKEFKNVSLVDLPLSTYDIVIVTQDNEQNDIFIRVQVKTAKHAVSFTGGTRGGVDRTYKSDVKTYKQSQKTSDIVAGLHEHSPGKYDLFIVSMILIDQIKQKSISISKISGLKNNYELIPICKDQVEMSKKLNELRTSKGIDC